MNRILLVEDSIESQRAVELALANDAIIVVAPTTLDAQKQLDQNRFDLILLDVVLPDADGFQFCASLQNSAKTKEIPIIFLSGKSGTNDKVMGYSLGAEDYITKPFAPAELRARVAARLRKIRVKKERNEVFRKGDLSFDVAFQRIAILNGAQETRIELTPHEFKLLLYLASNEERIFSRDQLITAVWGENVHITDRVIDVHVSSLRKKLSASSYSVKTIYGVGYTFAQKTPKQP